MRIIFSFRLTIRRLILPALFIYSCRLQAQVDTITAEQLPDSVSVNVESDTTTAKNYFSQRFDTLHVILRAVSPDAKKKYEEDDEFWYGNTDLKKTRREILEEKRKGQKGTKNENESAIRERKLRTPLMLKPWFQTMLWIIIISGFTLFLVIYLGNSNIGLFRRKVRKTTDAQDQQMPDDIFAINYQKEIDRAVTENNYSLAVRLHYLQLLKKLADRGIIHYTQDKTNFDYLVELQPTSYYDHFFRATRNYEYSWYGKFPVSENAYEVIRRDYNDLDKQLNRH